PQIPNGLDHRQPAPVIGCQMEGRELLGQLAGTRQPVWGLIPRPRVEIGVPNPGAGIRNLREPFLKVDAEGQLEEAEKGMRQTRLIPIDEGNAVLTGDDVDTPEVAVLQGG